jgi:hypothetical protein
MQVVGIGGQLQNGKDTAADYLATKLSYQHSYFDHYADPQSSEKTVANLPWERTAFASNVKRVYCDTFDVDLDFVEKWKTNPEPPPGFDQSVRQSLQFIGDGFRKIQGDIWIELTFRRRDKPCIISDVRYKNELAKVKKVGGITAVVFRPGYLNNDPNGSEAQMKPIVEFFDQLNSFGWSCGLVGSEEYCNALEESNLEVPDGVDSVDVFLRNDGDNTYSLFGQIDEILLPYIIEKYDGEFIDGKAITS